MSYTYAVFVKQGGSAGNVTGGGRDENDVVKGTYDMKTTGEIIKPTRQEKGISQNQLAKKAGVSQSGLSSIERDSNNPSIKTLALLCKALEVSPIVFFED